MMKFKCRFKCKNCSMVFEVDVDKYHYLKDGTKLCYDEPLPCTFCPDGWEGMAYIIAIKEIKDGKEEDNG